jgi:hypothetical protein
MPLERKLTNYVIHPKPKKVNDKKKTHEVKKHLDDFYSPEFIKELFTS